MYSDDLEQLDAGMVLYDALYRWCRDAMGETHDWVSHAPAPGVAPERVAERGPQPAVLLAERDRRADAPERLARCAAEAFAALAEGRAQAPMPWRWTAAAARSTARARASGSAGFMSR